MDQVVNQRAKELQKFGIVVGIAIMLVFGFLFPMIHSGFVLQNPPTTPLALGLSLIAAAFIRPLILDTFERVWMILGMKLGKINTRIMLFLMYWILLVPISYILRVFGKGTLQESGTSFKPNSYGIVIDKKYTTEQFEQPF